MSIGDELTGAGSRITRRILPEDRGNFASAQSWHDRRRLKVLGMGAALPGPPVLTSELLLRLEEHFGIALLRQGTALSNGLKIRARHLSRDFQARHETPRRGHSNPDLAAAALRQALEEARLGLATSPISSGIRPAPPACCRPTSPSSLTVSALPGRTWSCVKPVLALPMR
jgi:hypothetical protein